jgi:hypothetical protein
MPLSIITLTTDFGLRDPFVAEMKAVILSIASEATIIDITHEVEKFNVKTAAYILASASSYFPKGTIHVAVIDPSVGTRRRPILIQTKQCYCIGPDNGVIAITAKNQGIKHIYEISNLKLMMPNVSHTFHGRDIFAPAAAHLAAGVPPERFGSEIRDFVVPEFAKILRRKDVLVGEVLHVDDFGNIITNFRETEISQINSTTSINLKLKNTRLRLKLCKAYADVKPREPLAIIGSHNFLEISINQGNAAEKFKVKDGDKATLYCSQ